jgi:hypothetical protein
MLSWLTHEWQTARDLVNTHGKDGGFQEWDKFQKRLIRVAYRQRSLVEYERGLGYRLRAKPLP